MDYIPYKRYLELKLTPERYHHSLGVMHEMSRAAETFKLDKELAELAGLLHDAAKEMPLDQQIAFLEQCDPESLEHNQSCLHGVYLHGPVGAVLARRTLGITNPEILTAIKQHAGNYTNMSLLARCLHVTDMLVPTTPFLGTKKLRDLVRAAHLDEAELLLDVWLVEVSSQLGFPVHPNYTNRIHALTELLQPDAKFFDRA